MQEIPIYMKNSLRSLRIKFGYTQEEAASLIGVTTVTIRKWECDSERIPYAMVKRIEKAYNTDQSNIFFGKEVAFSEHLRQHRDQLLSTV